MQEIKYVPVDSLKSHPQNPRLIKDEEFRKLCDDIRDIDYFEVRPILCNPEMVIFAGNMRWRAAKEIGMAQVPVSIMDISEEQQRKIMILDNRHRGIWDFEMLANSFDIQELIGAGFSNKELHLDLPKMSTENLEDGPEKEEEKRPHCATCTCQQ